MEVNGIKLKQEFKKDGKIYHLETADEFDIVYWTGIKQFKPYVKVDIEHLTFDLDNIPDYIKEN